MMKRRLTTDIDNETAAQCAATGDINIHFKRERRKARKVIVERLRRERIDRCLEQLKHWLQDTSPQTAAATQGELYNLEKADILELTVNQLRQMVVSTELQCAVGYSACVQEVNNFLTSINYDDATRRRIVQHLCRRRNFLTSQAASVSTTSGGQMATPDAEQMMTSPQSETVDYRHLQMCSYNRSNNIDVHADSTTGLGDVVFESSTTSTCPASSSSHDVATASVLNFPSTTPAEPDQSVTVSDVGHKNDVSVCVVRHDDIGHDDNNNNNNNENDDKFDVITPADVWRPW